MFKPGLFILLVLSSVDALACEALARIVPEKARQQIVELAAKTGSPAFLKTTNRKGDEIPVLLVNAGTAETFRDFLESSMGTSVRYQGAAGSAHDHGGLRIGASLFDMAPPPMVFSADKKRKPVLSPRQSSVVNRTGISRLDLFENVEHRQKKSDGPIRIEVAYALTPEEYEAANRYHLARWAGLVRVLFRYVTWDKRGRFVGPSSSSRAPGDWRAFPEVCEMCFDFAKGSQLDPLIGAIWRRLDKLKLVGYGNDTQPFYADPALMEYVTKWRDKFLGLEDRSAEARLKLLSGSTFSNLGMKLAETRSRLGMSHLDKDEASHLVGLMITLTAAWEYRNLRYRLGMTPDAGYRDMKNERASAVLIYDASPEAEQAFREATYENATGAFSRWKPDGQRPIPLSKKTTDVKVRQRQRQLGDE